MIARPSTIRKAIAATREQMLLQGHIDHVHCYRNKKRTVRAATLAFYSEGNGDGSRRNHKTVESEYVRDCKKRIHAMERLLHAYNQ